ncbi:MAG: ferrous iron transport protein B [Bacteroidales bacterium]|nr:ferrous iron transport protein B [Candidatus Liminaster caballi]
MTLKDLHVNETGHILSVGGEGALRQHLLDMGMIPGVDVRIVKFAPMGDPVQINLQGYELTLRLDDAAKVEIEKVNPLSHHHIDKALDDTLITVHENEHPGLGEGGRYHVEHTAPNNGQLKFALVGNQNCGKTTLFNQLTGSNQHVGNFPGVTVDRKSGQIRGYQNTEVVDLPGIYSLSPYTNEEIVSRDFVLGEHPHGIINIVDATNIERNLYLTMQLMELGIPMVLALNMMDEVDGNGGTIRINVMEEALGIPVVAISAMKNQGIEELIRHAVHVAKYNESPSRKDFCSPNDHGGAVHRCLHAVMHLIEDHAEAANIPVRFAASKVVEGDALVIEALNLSDNELATVRHIVRQLEQERGLDAPAAMADMRFAFISRLCEKTVVHPKRSKEHVRSLRLDSILTGRFTALPSFILIIGLVFWLTFESLGAWLQDLLENGIGWATEMTDMLLTQWNINDAIHSLIIDGAFAGVGSVLSFVPLIVLLFFFLSMLEDSGYMARIAFVTDPMLRRIGLSGRSIVPMLVGFGCSVPSVMASRTLPSDRDRKLTILLTPFMSCTAKVAI